MPYIALISFGLSLSLSSSSSYFFSRVCLFVCLFMFVCLAGGGGLPGIPSSIMAKSQHGGGSGSGNDSNSHTFQP